MRIIYIEDELRGFNLIEMFEQFLTKEEVDNLEVANGNRRVFRAMKNNKTIKIISDFPEAINFINNDLGKFDLIIMDRNLLGNDDNYDIEKLPENFNEDFFEREGDFLLYQLIKNKFDIENQLYILTGNTDPFRGLEGINQILSSFFKENNVIYKGTESIDKIKNIIKDIELIKDKKYISILQQNFDKKLFENFITVLLNKDYDNDAIKNLIKIRKILEKIMRRLEKVLLLKSNKLTILGIQENLSRDKKNKVSDVILRGITSIWKTASAYGAHEKENSDQYQPTINTVNTLFYQLKDIILWFDEIIKKD